MPDTEKNLNVREVIQQLVNAEDMEAEVCMTLFNSDPVPVTSIDFNTEGQVILSNA